MDENNNTTMEEFVEGGAEQVRTEPIYNEDEMSMEGRDE